MPEVILPCPACGGDCLIVAKNYPSCKWHTYCDCGQIGRLYPTREEAIKAHNALPRALRWTHEPPKVDGWYWWRTSKGQNVNTIQVWSRSGVLGYCFDTEFITTLDRGEWAGPISTPIE